MPPGKKGAAWNRLGESEGAPQSETAPLKEGLMEAGGYANDGEELFNKEKGDKPWWLSRLLMSERTLFGAWDGVFTSCLVNLIGVIVFLRSGYVVCQAGTIEGTVIAVVTVLIVTTSVLSAIGIMSFLQLENAGVHSLIAHVLGSRIGGTMGLLYCFGQAVGISLCASGFGESMTELLHIDMPWADRAIGAASLLLLAVINLAGVKWVVKIQVLLLLLLLAAFLDFFIGSFTNHTEDGVTGWSLETFNNNSWSNYESTTNWFTVFGVFFPTVTGCLAGINMSGDIRNPTRNVPLGSLVALLFSLVIYVSFVMILGGTVSRTTLCFDNMITEKVSVTGVLLLIGLYTSTLASTLASLYSTPRVLQSIAEEKVIPIIAPLQKGKGPNKLPIWSLLVIVIITVSFLLVGPINTLAPIVTMPFMATYAVIDYAYFALSMTNHANVTKKGYVPTGRQYASTHSDLDRLFPERILHKKVKSKSAQSSDASSDESPEFTPKKKKDLELSDRDDLTEGAVGENELLSGSVARPGACHVKSPKWVTCLCNKWISLFAGIIKLGLMFGVQPAYGAVTLAVMVVLYYYIGQASPGLPPGIATNFNFFRWLKNSFVGIFRKPSSETDELIVPPLHPGMDVSAAQLTQENQDFANRSRFHQSRFGDVLEGMK